MSTLELFLRAAASADEHARERAYAEMLRFVRIVVRAEMGRKLRDHRESADVCQSIAKSFVDDFQAGRVEFANEQALAGYLRLAVRNKLAELARHDGALKRGGGERDVSVESVPEVAGDRADDGAGSISEAEWPGIRDSLEEDDRRLVELRMRGFEWDRVASELGVGAPAARQRFSRILRRLREERS